jgi:hypothetical protein
MLPTTQKQKPQIHPPSHEGCNPMKKYLILALLGLGLSVAPSALAVINGIEQDYLDRYRDDDRRPIPVSVVWPVVSKAYSGRTVDLLIEVDRHGRPRRITSRAWTSEALMKRLVAAVSQWQFAPRIAANGETIPAKVQLPVEIR